MVGQVVSTSQNAFVEGARITNEAVDSLIRRKEKGLLCKSDIEKAYDHLKWDFLLKVMEKIGFGKKWLIWIRWCISTTSFSVLVNGTPSGFFQSFSGLRQGDPLSPYLLVIRMEALSYLISLVEQLKGALFRVVAFVAEVGRGWLSPICYMRMIPFSFVGQIDIK